MQGKWETNPRWPEAPDEWLDPRPEYSRPLGTPLGVGGRGADGVWRRSFSSGTNVSFANTTGGGPSSTIAWADGHTQRGFSHQPNRDGSDGLTE
jgi:prepilin-type processing-associated H-X9-DG protein